MPAERLFKDHVEAARQQLLATRAAQPDGRTADLVDGAAAILIDDGVDGGIAAAAALSAWAALEGEQSQAYFDLEASTRDLVWIVDQVAGQRRAIAATDLLRLMGPRPVVASAAEGTGR